jgi:hypothetical protein
MTDQQHPTIARLRTEALIALATMATILAGAAIYVLVMS